MDYPSRSPSGIITGEETAMRRVTILGLMIVVLACGVGTAALNAATAVWDSIVFSATLLILTFSILLAVHGRGGFWLGFALFGWVYLVASLIPSVESRLLTTRAIVYLDARTANRQSLPVTVAFTNEGRPLLGWDEDTVRIWDTASGKPVLRPSGSIANFRRIGHSLFALLAGLLGAFIARRFEKQHPHQGD
jgi:hypothetical protein